MSSSKNLSPTASSPKVASSTAKSGSLRDSSKRVDEYEDFSVFPSEGLRSKSGFFDEGSLTLAKQALTSRKRLEVNTN